MERTPTFLTQIDQDVADVKPRSMQDFVNTPIVPKAQIIHNGFRDEISGKLDYITHIQSDVDTKDEIDDNTYVLTMY